jgi:hypothetical protein
MSHHAMRDPERYCHDRPPAPPPTLAPIRARMSWRDAKA